MTPLSDHPQVAAALRTGYPEPDLSWTPGTEHDYAVDNLADFIHYALNDEDFVRDFVEQNLDAFLDWMRGNT